MKEPSCDLKDLIDNNEGLILLTGNSANFFGKLFSKNLTDKISELIVRLKKVFKDNLYLEIQRHNDVG